MSDKATIKTFSKCREDRMWERKGEISMSTIGNKSQGMAVKNPKMTCGGNREKLSCE